LLWNNGKSDEDSRKASGDSRKDDDAAPEGSRINGGAHSEWVATSSDVESSGNDAGEATPTDLEYSRTALETINIGRSPGQSQCEKSQCLLPAEPAT
jgi:hypothetical protein